MQTAILLTFTVLSISGCSPTTTASTAAGGSGKAASENAVPDEYSDWECLDLTDDVSCGGYYVLACCNQTECGYVVTDGETGGWAVMCASTSDCDAAATELLAYCGGGDTGGAYDTSY